MVGLGWGCFCGRFVKVAFLGGLGRDDGDPGVSVARVEQASLPAGIAWHAITKHTT